MTGRSKEEVVQEFRIQSIQEAAMRVIARKGMAAATMQEIAAEAGIAKGTIYLYFRDRDELVERTFDTAMTQLHGRLEAALQSQGSFQDRLRAMLAAKIEFFRENREFFRLYMSLRLPEGSPRQQRRHKRICQPQFHARLALLASFLESAMSRGEIRRMDPQRLALFLIEGSNAVVIDRVTDESPPAESSDVDFIAELLLKGIEN